MTVSDRAAEAPAGVDMETLSLAIESLHDFVAKQLPESRQLELDHDDICPEDLVRAMCGDELGLQLLFVPEEYGGMGGGAVDVYRLCEHMARVDIGLATSVLATFLGSDPITVGATAEQKATWLSRIADEGILFAYGATEPEAGSDLGALRTTATPVVDDGAVVGYRLTGRKQWISNGGIADAYTILAAAPGGPSWFVLERGAEGFTPNRPEDKHGIRLSNTAALFLDDVFVPIENLVGGVEGQGLVQAQQVFGYTRLMVAAFGLGGGWSALDRAIAYSTMRVQAGGPLSGKQGYTHKLIVPHLVRLEAARALIEQTGVRIDAGEGVGGALNTEGAIAKYLATEAGNAAADAAIQAHGGYGYTRDYLVEKIKRDVRITTIYEGTSEIMEMTIARDRWQQHPKTGGVLPRPGGWSAGAARGAPGGGRRRGRPLLRGAGRGPGGLPARPADPKPARPAPPRRADRVRRGGCEPGRPGRGRHGRHPPPKADTRFHAADVAAINRVYARGGGLEGRRAGGPADRRVVSGSAQHRRPGRVRHRRHRPPVLRFGAWFAA